MSERLSWARSKREAWETEGFSMWGSKFRFWSEVTSCQSADWTSTDIWSDITDSCSSSSPRQWAWRLHTNTPAASLDVWILFGLKCFIKYSRGTAFSQYYNQRRSRALWWCMLITVICNCNFFLSILWTQILVLVLWSIITEDVVTTFCWNLSLMKMGCV